MSKNKIVVAYSGGLHPLWLSGLKIITMLK